MGRVLVFLIALVTLGYLAYYTMYRGRPGDETQTPKAQLDNVRQAADRIEKEQAEHVEDILNKTQE